MNVASSGARQFHSLQLFRLALDSRMRRGDKFFASPLPCPDGHDTGNNGSSLALCPAYFSKQGVLSKTMAVAALFTASQNKPKFWLLLHFVKL
jgi:hypothetical protein